MSRNLKVRIGDSRYEVQVPDLGSDPLEVLVDGVPVTVDLTVVAVREPPEPAPEQELNDVDVPVEQEEPAQQESATPPSRAFRTPMPGVILSVLVKTGDQVVTGDEICVLEAMKMHQILRADWSGIIKTVHVQEGQQVLDGDIIADLE